MKVYKIRVVVTKTVLFTEDEWRQDGGFGELDDFLAIQYAKGCLVEDLANDPNRGSAKILFNKDY